MSQALKDPHTRNHIKQMISSGKQLRHFKSNQPKQIEQVTQLMKSRRAYIPGIGLPRRTLTYSRGIQEVLDAYTDLIYASEIPTPEVLVLGGQIEIAKIESGPEQVYRMTAQKSQLRDFDMIEHQLQDFPGNDKPPIIVILRGAAHYAMFDGSDPTKYRVLRIHTTREDPGAQPDGWLVSRFVKNAGSLTENEQRLLAQVDFYRRKKTQVENDLQVRTWSQASGILRAAVREKVGQEVLDQLEANLALEIPSIQMQDSRGIQTLFGPKPVQSGHPDNTPGLKNVESSG